MAKGRRSGSKAVVDGGQNIVVARRRLGLKSASSSPIGMLSQQLDGGKSTFMQFARLAVHIDPSLAPIIESYDTLTGAAQSAVSIDEICAKHEIDPLHFIAVVGEAALKYGENSAIVIAALRFPEIINRSVKEGLKPGGFKDREAMMKHAKFIPTPHGINIGVSANAASRSDSSAAPESKGLPSFERSMHDTDEIINENE